MLLFSITFLLAGLYILIKKKPIIFIQIFPLVSFIMVLQGFINVINFADSKIFFKNNLLFIFYIVCFLIFLALFIALKSYIVFGINEEDFGRVVINTLNSLNIKYEQIKSEFSTINSNNNIKITDPKYEISITLKPIGGFFYITQIKGKRNTVVFYKIIKEVKKNIMNTYVRVETKRAIICLAIGISILLFISAIYISF